VPPFEVDQREERAAIGEPTRRELWALGQPSQAGRPAWPDDAQLAERLVSGDAWAREVLYRKYVDAVWGLSLRLMGNRSEAEDIVQDTFIEAYRDVGQLRKGAAIRGWLLRITVHQAHRRFRRRRLLRALGLERGVDSAELDKLATPGASAEVVVELALLQRQLSALPANQRIAWSLRVIEGYALEEVARLCQCSLASAKRHISAAQARIDQHIAFEASDD
jgi:RNA polymerase sigma-70 factor (ECF subfamily)